MRVAPLVVLLAVVACRPAGGGGTETTTTTTTGATSTTGLEDACERSADCDTDSTEGICVAVYVPADTLGGDRGPATCATPGECIAELDLGRWCFDHPGCCEGLRCRAVDGICERPHLGQDTDTDGDTDTSGSTSDASTTSGTSGSSTDASTTDASTTDASTTDATSSGTGTTG
ncbi:MAG: hypothetical protein R3B09_16100 [Nannocystaceae bacterium]